MSASGKSIYSALMEARKAMGPLIKDHTAKIEGKTSFSYKYATLESVIDVIDGPLGEAGIIWTQRFETRDDGVLLLVTEFHYDGQGLLSRMPVHCANANDPRAMGSAITYYRRYALITMCGLTPEDDDGNAASQNAPVRSPEPRSATQGTVVTDGDLSVPEYAAAVKKAIESRRGDDLVKLVDMAGDNIGRWITLVKSSNTEQALDWIEKQIETRDIRSVPLNTEIGKQRAKVQQ